MCGICGYVSKFETSTEQLDKMNNTMIHRGPNDSGLFVMRRENQFIGLAQRRLAVIDLTPGGHQPMFSQDKSIALVLNGEIYNYRELKKELRNNYKFVSESDTEVVIAAYLTWGIDFLNRLNGMFAIGLYDFRDEKLLLARDRMGKKPLYYYSSGEVFVFGSELKPLMHHPEFKKTLRTDLISQYLYQDYINAPDTIFENTFKLESATYLVLQNGLITKKVYWDVIENYFTSSEKPSKDYIEAKEGLIKLLDDGVRQRMISHVPLGTFLSGGIDSSLVTAIAQKNSNIPIKTFSIGFNEKEYNEAVFAKAIAKRLGTEHYEMYITELDMLKQIDSIPDYYDEPFADPSQIPTMLLAKFASEQVTVALSGDGGDELFCGYGEYDTVLKYQKYDLAGQVAHNILNIPGIRDFRIIDRLSGSAQRLINNRDNRCKTQLGHDEFTNIAYCLTKGKSSEVRYLVEDRFNIRNWVQRRMLVDILTYLPEDILQKVDRASMKYSLEARCPLLDYRLVNYSFRLPHNFKYFHGEKKYILKDILYDYIPKEHVDRPKKGFSAPIAKWLKGPLKSKLEFYSDIDRIVRQDIFNPNQIKLISERFKDKRYEDIFAKYLWNFLIFQMWYEKYIATIL